MTPSERDELKAEVLREIHAAAGEATLAVRELGKHSIWPDEFQDALHERIPSRDESGEGEAKRDNVTSAYNDGRAQGYAKGKRAGRLEGLREALEIVRRNMRMDDTQESIEAAIHRAEEADDNG